MANLDSSSVRLFSSFVADEPDAAAQLFHRYLQRLCRLAQTRLAPRLAQRLDAEDVVMSAYRSFFVNAKAGRFWIQESGDLWALLVKITLRKLSHSAAHHAAEKRSVLREQPLDGMAVSDGDWVVAEQPSPEEAVSLADEVESVLRSLSQEHRRIVELRLQGELIDDIAHRCDLSERTVRRVLGDLELQLRQRHRVSDGENIRVTPVAKTESLMDSVKPVSSTVNTIPFDNLLLKKLIGAGGMGKVYKAVSRSFGKPLAVKFLHKSLQNNCEIVERFLNEAAVIQRLTHPGIQRIEGIGRTKAGVYFIVMPFIEGRNLAEQIADGVPSIRDATRWITRVADAIQHAHESGIIHCDLKPANVLLSTANEVVVTDFGMARLTGDAAAADNFIAGTAAWMAPEQVDPVFGPISVRTDVYGLGALFYSMLTGRPPFAGIRIPDVLARVVGELPVAPTLVRPEIPAELARLCLQCLSRTAADRFDSAADFLTALQLAQ